MISAINELSISYYKLTKTERLLAKKILSTPIVIVNNPISSSAEIFEASVSSIQRLAKKIGFTGYSELRFTLANELKLKESDAVNLSNPMNQIVDGYKENIEELRKEIYYNHSLHIRNMILDAKSLYIVGLGGSSFIAGYLEHMLYYGVRKANLIFEQERFDYLDGIIRQGDVIIIFSVSGAESIFKQYDNESFKNKGVKVVLITMNGNTAASSMADHLVVLPRVPLAINGSKEPEIFIDNNTIFTIFVNIILFTLKIQDSTKSIE